MVDKAFQGALKEDEPNRLTCAFHRQVNPVPQCFGGKMRLLKHAFAALLSLSFVGLSAYAGEVVPVAAENHILGVIQYRGGFSKDLPLQLAAPTALRGFKVSAPEFCHDVEILEAAAKSNLDSVAVRRSPTEENTFFIERTHDADTVVTSLLLTVNGPLTAGCDIPLFDIEGDDPVPPPQPQHPADGYFRAQNNPAAMIIERGRVTRHNFIVTSPGVHHSGAVVLTSPLLNSGFDSSTYNIRAYADFPVNGPMGPGFCRFPVSFDLNYRHIAFGDMTMRFNYPGQVGLDFAGRCFAGPMVSMLLQMRRAN